MDAATIFERIDRACEAAFGGSACVEETAKTWDQKHNELLRVRSAENANYRLQIGDGVCLDGSYLMHTYQGVIEWIDGDVATVIWSLPLGKSLVEKVKIRKLIYSPTLLQIYGKIPGDPHTVPDENCLTAQIRREWNDVAERQANNFPNPHAEPPVTSFGNRSDNRDIGTRAKKNVNRVE